MKYFNYRRVMRQVILLLIFFFFNINNLWSSSYDVEIKTDATGSYITVDKRAFDLKGVVWNHIPPGEDFNYSLWKESDEYIRTVIDRECSLMKVMGVNTIRTMEEVPVKWIEYIYYNYGIYSIVNHYFARYGVTVNGRYYPHTNYSDPETQTYLLSEVERIAKTYKDVDGVLLVVFGNENNYDLTWEDDSFDHIPLNQRTEARGRHLYALFNRAAEVYKTIDRSHPVGLANGDAFLAQLVNLAPEMDFVGSNVYRGFTVPDGFFDTYKRVNKPVLFLEMGADAHHAIEDREIQDVQAEYLTSQWKAIYDNSYGKGVGNCLGGFISEWSDNWWKNINESRAVHNSEGSITNHGYKVDARSLEHNVNFEWLGLLEYRGEDRSPRVAYYTMKDLWVLPLINSTQAEIDEHFSSINPIDKLSLVNDYRINQLRQIDNFLDVSYSGVAGTNFFDDEVDEDNHFYLNEMDLTVNILGVDNLSGFITTKVRNGEHLGTFETQVGNTDVVELYRSYVKYDGSLMDAELYFHEGHTDYTQSGDFMGLYPETFDMEGMDIGESKAPVGIELTGNGLFEGLTLFGGPEIFWDAEPRLLTKYYREGDSNDFSIMADIYQVIDTDETDNPVSIELEDPFSIRGSLYYRNRSIPKTSIETGLLISGIEYLDAEYEYAEVVDDVTYYYMDQNIDFMDTLSGKIKLTNTSIPHTRLYIQYHYAGLVSFSELSMAREGFMNHTFGSGNKQEVILGADFRVSDLSIHPLIRYRKPLVGANALDDGSAIENLFLRRVFDDPFYVWYNRELLQLEMVITYDEQLATYYHDWDNDDREWAPLAGSLHLDYKFFAGPTDRFYYYDGNGVQQEWGDGLEEASNLYTVKTKITSNLIPGSRTIFGAKIGREQSMGSDDRIVDFSGLDIQHRVNNWMIKGDVRFNDWGSQLWYRDFNITYPVQWEADIAYGFELPKFGSDENRIGLRVKGRTLDEYALDDGASRDEWDDGNNEFMSEIELYYNISF